MGVKDLMKVLKIHCPNVLHTSLQTSLHGNIWIDTPLIIVAAAKIAESEGKDAYALIESTLHKTLRQVLALWQNKNDKTIFWIFDGKRRNEKEGTVVSRTANHQKYSLKCNEKSIQRYFQLQQSETILSTGLQQSETLLNTDLQYSETVLNMDLQQSETILNMDLQQSETVLNIDLQQSSHLETNLKESQQKIETNLNKSSQLKTIIQSQQQTENVRKYSTLANDIDFAQSIITNHYITPNLNVNSVYKLTQYAKTYIVNANFEHSIVQTAKHDSEEHIARCMEENDIAISSDSDALPFGCKRVVQHFGTSKETWIELNDVLNSLHFSLIQFRLLCVLLGNDFNSRVYKQGCVSSFDEIKKITNDEDLNVFLQTYALKHKTSEEWLLAAQKSLCIFNGY